jgi:hypothetical protein
VGSACFFFDGEMDQIEGKMVGEEEELGLSWKK